ncbi:MAG: SH3 domain-containing protein [Anaerolineae bacterium]|nr:SH3 domain-containing protein [Anaerolineae bacterium]
MTYEHKGLFTNLWQGGCLLLLFGSIVAVAVLGIWLFSQTPELPSGPRPTAIVWTATPTSPPTSTPVPTPTPHPTTPTPSGNIIIGIQVYVSGTGESGLSIRAASGLQAERLSVALEGERFLIVGGPQEADGITWWLLRDEANPDREGWAAANYLIPE